MPHIETVGLARSTARPTILVVEDELLIRWAIADYLRESGFHVAEAGDVPEAKLVLAAEGAIAVIFTDVQMPGAEDGFDLAIWVRANYGAVHVIVTSGWSGAAQRASAAFHGGAIIAKPYQYELVLRHIRELLAQAPLPD